MEHSRTAIITGASTGIGYSLAYLLASKGYDLGIIARRPGLLGDLKAEIQKKFPMRRVFFYACDVGNEASIFNAISELHAKLGSLDLFVANAGIGFPTPAFKENWNDVKDILRTNIFGAIGSLEAAKEIMMRQGSGHLVGVSSVAGFRGLPGSSAYCTSKAALTTYLESIRLDLYDRNISVTTIQPGFIETPLTSKNRFPMPFIMKCDEAARVIYAAIRSKRSRLVFPWQMKIFTWLMRVVPNWIYDLLIKISYNPELKEPKRESTLFSSQERH